MNNSKRDPILHTEYHDISNSGKLNWLRASVLGANDGIVSIASMVLGVAGVSNDINTILISGIAGTIAGAFSMAAGEYVSVSTQKDTEEALLKKEKWELEQFPKEELEELINIYEKKGFKKETAVLVANELTEKDAYKAHIEAELNIDPDNIVNPWHAAYASAISFLVGSMVPLLTIAFAPQEFKIIATYVSIIISLSLTGGISAHIGNSNRTKAMVRVVLGGVTAMTITYIIGLLFGLVLH